MERILYHIAVGVLSAIWRYTHPFGKFSDNPALLGAPEGFRVTVRNVKVSAGAGFLVALTGDIMTMPGLPKKPAAVNIDVDADGKITGLF